MPDQHPYKILPGSWQIFTGSWQDPGKSLESMPCQDPCKILAGFWQILTGSWQIESMPCQDPCKILAGSWQILKDPVRILSLQDPCRIFKDPARILIRVNEATIKAVAKKTQKLSLSMWTLSLPWFSVQVKNKICKNLNSVQQLHEHHHYKVLIESFHLSVSHLKISLDTSGFRSFLGLVKFTFGTWRINQH